MVKNEVPVTVEHRKGPGNEETTTETHPSYGLISLGRYTCSPAQNFFGSAIKHHAGISLSIRTAEKHRNLSNDWYHSTGEIIEITMTAAQLSDLLTCMNVGDGIPCTLNHVWQTPALAKQFPQASVPKCPEVTMRQVYEEEFKKDMQAIAKSLENLIAAAQVLADKPSVNKADRKSFVNIAEGIRCKLANCLPFVQGQFNEAMDKVLSEAKKDLESFTDQLTHSLGSAALQQQVRDAKPEFPTLELGGGEDYTSPKL